MGELPEDVARGLNWVADGVALVPGAPEGAQSILIDDGDVLLVDAGLSAETTKRLAPYVDVLLLSHTHVTHLLQASAFREVWAPREEAEALESEEGYMDVAEVPQRHRETYARWLREAGYAPCDVQKAYRPDGLLRFDENEWHLLHAPGHSPGLTFLYDEEREILFSADLGDHPLSPWYGDPACDLDELERTTEEMAALDVRLLLTSHGAPRKRGIPQIFQDLTHRIRERDRRILAFCDRPRSIDDLLRMGFITRPQTPMEMHFERVMLEKHLGRLLERDFLIARQDGRYERAM